MSHAEDVEKKLVVERVSSRSFDGSEAVERCQVVGQHLGGFEEAAPGVGVGGNDLYSADYLLAVETA